MMNGKAPHIVQYQGSKRLLAPQILRYMPARFDRLIEPFSGMAAISVAAAYGNRANRYCINDLNAPLIRLLQAAIERPAELLSAYTALWNEQFEYGENHVQHFYNVRDSFNGGDTTPAKTLYLLARCVKGAVRYGKSGNFNQSPDKRRHGTSPATLESNVYAISNLLKGKATFSALDYHEILSMARPGDLVYMDPPYQGVTNGRDNRYFAGVSFSEFSDAIESLNTRGVDFLISYDGECGGKTYGEELPQSLNCRKVLLNAGLSSQATLLGRQSTTLEALYISPSLCSLLETMPKQPKALEALA